MLGNSQYLTYFQRHIDADTLRNSYIFFGEKHIGKATFARCLAFALEQSRSVSEAVDEFYDIENANHFLQDVLLIDSDKPGIDDIRAVKRFLSRRPTESSHRTVVVEHAENMTEHGQHAMLKLSEDAHESTLLILVTSSKDVLLPTIISRFVPLYFTLPKKNEVLQWMQSEFSLDTEAGEELYVLGSGRPGKIRTLHENKGYGEQLREFFAALRSRDAKTLFSYVEKIAAIDDDESTIKRREYIDDFFRLLFFELKKTEANNTFSLTSDILRRELFLDATNANKKMQLENAVNIYLS